MEPLKNEKLASKQKLRKYIKKIKLQHLKGDEDGTPSLENMQVKTIDSPKVTNANNPFRVT